MKKFFTAVMSIVLIVMTTFAFSACTKKIDGVKFSVTKSMFTAKYTAGADTDDDKTDDIFNVTLSINITITITQQDKVHEIKRENFKISHESIEVILKNSLGKAVDMVEVKGPLSEEEDFQPKVYFISIAADYGGGKTYDEVESLKSSLSLSYNGTDLKLGLITVLHSNI